MNDPNEEIRRFWGAIALAVTLLFSILIAVGVRTPSIAPPPIPVTACEIPIAAIAPDAPWRFQLDPNDVGLAEGWQTAVFDDTLWDESAPGAPWENSDYDYDGVAWYRATFTIPADWQSAYLSTLGIDDSATLWLNGVETPIEAALALPIGERVQISYRVVDNGGFGGIKKAVRVGESLQAVLPTDDFMRSLADEAPDWPQPGWVEERYHAWTFTSAPQTTNEALITADVDVSPWADAPLVSLWVQENGVLHAASEASFSLTDGFLPIPEATWQMAGLAFRSTLAARPDGSGTYWQTAVSNPHNERKTATLLLAVRPMSVEADRRPIFTTHYADEQLSLNGEPFLRSQPAATVVEQGNLLALTESLNGRLDPANDSGCTPEGTRAVLLAYPISLAAGEEETLTVAFPAEPGQPVPAADAGTAQFSAAREQWQTRLGNPILSVPDGFVMAGYRASEGYLNIALDPNGPHPGPLEHDALWVRDAAYIGATLLTMGEEEIVAGFIPSLFEFQQPDGFIPAIIEPGSGPRPDVEWDSQGQLIYLIGEYHRYTGDDAQVREWYPAVRAAAEFLRELRASTANDPDVSRGILPPSKSAEDLGSADWHHYWDSFWGIAGLTYGAELAADLGYAEDAIWMQAEADGLRESLLASITAVMGPEPAYIPNGPEDIVSSAMARGSTNSLYPVEIFSRDDPLIIRSFDEYHAQWIAPQNGGYVHIFAQLWPYGGLGLARNYVRLGRQDVVHQILGWTLTNQTLPGTFSWAEQVSQTTGAITGGDMPHAWAASSYITLIREMLLIDEPTRLELFAGVPGSWLEVDEAVTLNGAPTPFGDVTAVLQGNLTQFDPEWQGSVTISVSGATPPDGYRWRLPQRPARIETDDGILLEDGWLLLPPNGGTAVLHFE